MALSVAFNDPNPYGLVVSLSGARQGPATGTPQPATGLAVGSPTGSPSIRRSSGHGRQAVHPRHASHCRIDRLRRTHGAEARDPRRELMRLLIDMNLIPRWAPFLRNAGHEAVHWSSVGSISVKDGHICDYAPPTWLCNF